MQGRQSSLTYHLYIDGKETWNMTLLSPEPVKSKSAGLSFWKLFNGKN